ncbi:MAG: sugar-transfer associated ATP-grasp domain-containing protein [Hominenteromicrobium sp.]
MLKFELLMRRIRGFDFHRMMVYVRDVKKETRMPSALILLDMLLCIPLYNVGFYDYHIFGFVHIRRHRDRKTFFTMQDNWRLTRLVNDPADIAVFKDKILFCESFAPFLGREFLDLRRATAQTLAGFLNAHPTVFVKAPGGFGGLEVERFNSTECDLTAPDAVKKLYDTWTGKGFFLVEEALTQHPDMRALYPSSLNTMRVVTLTDKAGEVHVLYCFIRTGRGGAYVDNTTSGGFSALVCEDGVVRRPAISDKTGEYFDVHPDTGCSFINFRVPCYQEALELCKKAAKVRPGMRYVGWDVGITPQGPVLVEGNDLPAYDGQIYRQQEHPGTGLKPRIRAIIPEL